MSVSCPHCQASRTELSLIELAENKLICCGARVGPEVLAKMVMVLMISERPVNGDQD